MHKKTHRSNKKTDKPDGKSVLYQRTFTSVFRAVFFFYKVKLHSLTSECMGLFMPPFRAKGQIYLLSAVQRVEFIIAQFQADKSFLLEGNIVLSCQYKRVAMIRFASPVLVKGNMSHLIRSSNNRHERFLSDTF